MNEAAMQQRPAKFNSAGAGFLGLFVLVALLVVGYLWAAKTVYNPESMVRAHADAIIAGDAEKMTAIAAPTGGAAELFRGDALRNVEDRPTDFKIVAASRDNTSAHYTVEFHQGDAVGTVEYELKRGGTKALFFEDWRAVNITYPELSIAVPSSTPLLKINGAVIDFSEQIPEDAVIGSEVPVSLSAIPGVYTVTLGAESEFFTVSGEQKYSLSVAGESTRLEGGSPFKLGLTDAGRQEIQAVTNREIDACATQPVPAPNQCPMQAWTYEAFENGAWQIIGYPTVVVNEETGAVTSNPENGGAAGSSAFSYNVPGQSLRKEVTADIIVAAKYRVLPDQTIRVIFDR
ncbi:hypothetical protein [Canibacter zhoujuaniae]|uniref:hypothetical protein n=1 Tax=Canibacter zhoujuaniae TaxID=2708343 RepID=UPI00141DE99B|nr:hypothetical protein [Canibacter zhoujuaniae]